MRVQSLYSPEEVSGAGKRENSAEADRTLGQTGPAGQYPREQLLELYPRSAPNSNTCPTFTVVPELDFKSEAAYGRPFSAATSASEKLW